jgi:tRNA A37 N6-isopentenylltransferase MiaA
MYLVKYLSCEASQALEKFIKHQPSVVAAQIHENVSGDSDKGTDAFINMFMRTSDYAKKKYSWIQNKMDTVEVEFKKRKVIDPNSLDFAMSTSPEHMGGCGCGSCG